MPSVVQLAPVVSSHPDFPQYLRMPLPNGGVAPHITGADMRVIHVLVTSTHESLKDLAEQARVSYPTVRRSVERLRKAGIVA